MTLQFDNQTYYDQHVLEYRERQRLAWIDKRNREALRLSSVTSSVV